jgi:hypothetical protein
MTVDQHAILQYINKEHINQVKRYLGILENLLKKRGHNHDKSKLEKHEKNKYEKAKEKLDKLHFGGDEYKKELENIEPALHNHYKYNTHHPEHYGGENAVTSMNLLDILEMFCDWKAISLNTQHKDLKHLIFINCKKYNISPQLHQILLNSVHLLHE